jgi:polyphosphate kinase 2 (PPK2 family)
MRVSPKQFRVSEGHRVDLKKWATKIDPVYKSKDQCQRLLDEHITQLSSLQQLLYSSNRYAVLLIFQGMDPAGKDGTIKHVMSGVNPQGCQVFSFKRPEPAHQLRPCGFQVRGLCPAAAALGASSAVRSNPFILHGRRPRGRDEAMMTDAA